MEMTGGLSYNTTHLIFYTSGGHSTNMTPFILPLAKLSLTSPLVAWSQRRQFLLDHHHQKRKSDDKEQHNAMRFKMVKEIQNLNKRMDLAMKMELESKKFDIMTLIETNTNASEGIKKVWNERKDEIQKQIDEMNEKLQMDM